MKKQINFTRLKIQFVAFILITACMLGLNKPANAQVKDTVKNIVIVHGAFADGSGWAAVYKILAKKGYNVTIVQNPLTSLEDDVVATNHALDRQVGPVILVGHSWAGTVITQAGVSPKVARLVYIAAYIPEVGETTLQLASSEPVLPENGIMLPDENGVIYYSKEKFHKGFAGDLSKEEAAFLYDSQGAIALKALAATITKAAWKTKPSYAVVATEDKSINPIIVRKNAKRAGAITTEIKGSHAVYISQPKKIAEVIEAAATGVVK